MTVPYIFGSTAKPCLSFTEISCGFQAYAKFFSQDVKKVCSDECPLECEHQTFDYQISSLSYPSQAYYKYLMQQPDIVNRFGLNASQITYEKMKNSILRLNIYYETLSYTKIEEAIKVQLFDMISGIGGTLVTFKSILKLLKVNILV